MIKKLFIILASLPLLSIGQQTSLLSHYYENTTLFNPSLTGLNQNTSITLNARQQWYKFTDDSNIGKSSLSFNKGFGDDGFGAQVFTDNSGNITNSGFSLSYSRRVVIDEESFLFYGLSGGYQNNNIDNISSVDIGMFNNKFNWTPNASFGASFTRKSLIIGLSVDGLLESDLGFTTQENILEKHYYGFVAYDHSVTPTVKLSPSIFYKQAESGASQFDMNVNIGFKDLLRFGLGYKGNFSENENFGPMVTIGLNFSNIKSLISQEFTTSEVSSYSVGTTELTLKYEVKNNDDSKEEKKDEEAIEEEKVDSDNDGVFDDEDECPNLFGSVAAKGCPDIDNDGVRDSQDLCPNTIGEMLNNGCPILSEKDSIILKKAMTNLEFDKNSTRITPSSYSYVSNIGKLLLGNKNMVLIISGHTDSDASDEYNYNLSAKRAQSVRNYLSNMGISKSRLIMDFYGESKPLYPNDNDSNMQKNRRVEFNISFI
ncbi:MAG: PorP/SprF family type IX secretion system membrane protein [Flavobacteriales bacterium]|nr:PorP/SprF family type IX secretion system membrane protein [Flavobacteriales bacterium]